MAVNQKLMAGYLPGRQEAGFSRQTEKCEQSREERNGPSYLEASSLVDGMQVRGRMDGEM
jgi:hypothetical protein